MTQSRKPANNVTYIHTGGLRVPNAAVRTAATAAAATASSYPRVDTRLALTCRIPRVRTYIHWGDSTLGSRAQLFRVPSGRVGGGGGRGRGRSRNGMWEGRREERRREKEISGEKRRKRIRIWRRLCGLDRRLKEMKQCEEKSETEKLQKKQE